jgi:hypothetical protein
MYIGGERVHYGEHYVMCQNSGTVGDLHPGEAIAEAPRYADPILFNLVLGYVTRKLQVDTGQRRINPHRLLVMLTTRISITCITCKITPWSRVLLENLPGPQLVKKFLIFYGT